MKKKANIYTNYQQRATEFAVGDPVTPYYASSEKAGRVTAVYPAIGMVDVEFPHGSKRYPVEELQILDSRDFWVNPPHTDSAPGNSGQVSVPGGPYFYPHKDKHHDYKKEQEIFDKMRRRKKLASNVSERFEKKALYWANIDRKYRANRGELNSDQYTCPKCRDAVLKRCVYKRRDGVSDRLMGCPSCMFLIKRSDILGCEEG